jgi:glycosyltransferase involved in cell wall biosynthesis
MLDQIVPVILTYDESANIGRCLARLTWARKILVVDSYSTDNTLLICARYPNVRVVQRHFDSHANQWNFALAEATPIAPWMLAMDADYMLSDEFVKEIATLTPDENTGGYRCRFKYAIFGRILRSGLYPPVTALFRFGGAHYVQDGHTQRVVVAGGMASLTTRILHDDRKSLDRWILSQRQYASLEARKLAGSAVGHRLDLRTWLRARTPLSPLAVAAYCLIIRGGIFEGPPGWYYALQRMSAEGLICAAMLDAELRKPTPTPASPRADSRDVHSES